MQASGFDCDHDDDHACVRGMRADGGPVGASAAVFELRERGVLRLVEEQARDEAFPDDAASADAVG
jgi:hypothetical protein